MHHCSVNISKEFVISSIHLRKSTGKGNLNLGTLEKMSIKCLFPNILKVPVVTCPAGS